MQPSPIKVDILGKDKLSKQLDAIEKRSKNFRKKLKAVGGTLTRRVSMPLAAAGGVSLKFAKDFSKGMGEIATLLPGNVKRVKELKKEILDMAVKTGMPLEDVRQATYDIISAFGDSADTTKILETTMKTARAGATSGKEAIDLLSGVTLAYGEASKEAIKHTANLAFTAMRAGKTTIGEMSQAVLEATSYTSQFGATQEKLFATLGHLAGVTGTTSKAAIQLKGVYNALLTPTKYLSKNVKLLGYESAAALGKGLDTDYLMKALKILSLGGKKVKEVANSFGYASFVKMKAALGEEKAINKVSDATETSMENLGKVITRSEGKIAVLGATGKASERYEKMVKKTANAEGALEQAMKDQTTGVGEAAFKWDQTVEKMKKAAIVIGDKLMPVVMKLFDQISPLLDGIANMSEETLGMTLKFAGLAMALGPAINLTGNFLSVISGSRKAIQAASALGESISGLSSSMAMMGKMNYSKTTKFLSYLKSTGFVVGAGAIGAGAGTLISKIFLEPQAAEKAMELSNIIDRRHELRKKALEKESTVKEKIAATKELKQKGAEFALGATVENPLNFLAGQISSLFTDVESPLEMIRKEAAANIQLQKDLFAAADKQAQKEVKVTINNKSDNALEVKQGAKTKKVPANTGAVMDGS